MEARPPALIESVVRRLVPPAAREHVLGDLAERYSTPGQYLGDAIRTVPFVIASQIRRTSYIALWPMVLLMLAAGFSARSGDGLLRGLLPAIATLVAFMLRDAYKVPDPAHLWRQGVTDAIIAASGAVASQAVIALVRPDWLIAPQGALGGAFVISVLYLLRMQSAGGTHRLAAASLPSAMTLDELRREVASYARVSRRNALIEIGTGCVAVPVFIAIALFADSPFVRVGAGLTIAGSLFVIGYIRRGLKQTPPVPTDHSFPETVTDYRTRLQHHSHVMRTAWAWYMLPLGLGPTLMMVTGAIAAPRPDAAAAGVLVFVVVTITVARLIARSAGVLHRKLASLDHLEEQS